MVQVRIRCRSGIAMQVTHKRLAGVVLGLAAAAGLATGLVLATSGGKATSGRKLPPLARSGSPPVEYSGLAEVRVHKCGANELARINASTPVMTTEFSDEPRSSSPGSAMRIPRGTLLILDVSEKGTNMITMSSGCYVPSRSSVQSGMVLAAFYLDKRGQERISVQPRDLAPGAINEGYVEVMPSGWPVGRS